MLADVIDAVASWQQDGTPVQLHPGDLGWNAGFGAQALAAELRVWRRGGRILAAGMVTDDIGLIRMAIAPSVTDDEEFAAHLLKDLSNPDRGGVLPSGCELVEARFGAAFRDVLRRNGWVDDEPWTPLCRDLTDPVQDCGLRVETIDSHHVRDEIVRDRVAVQRASFPNSTFTLQRWQAMAASPAYRRARCLVAYDGEGHAVAATTVCALRAATSGVSVPTWRRASTSWRTSPTSVDRAEVHRSWRRVMRDAGILRHPTEQERHGWFEPLRSGCRRGGLASYDSRVSFLRCSCAGSP